MPNYFTLTRKGETKPATFVEIDNEICAREGVKPHEKYYWHSWYDCIGLLCAVGKTWDQQREILADDPALLRVIDYLEAHYTTDAWYMHR